jgi:hypothetical protein
VRGISGMEAFRDEAAALLPFLLSAPREAISSALESPEAADSITKFTQSTEFPCIFIGVTNQGDGKLLDRARAADT